MNFTQRLVIAICLAWIAIAMFFALINVDILFSCTNKLTLIIFYWLKYSSPALIMTLLTFSLDKRNGHRFKFLNSRSIKFSMTWLICSLVLIILSSLSSLESRCWSGISYSLISFILDTFPLLLLLQMPLILYWLICWVIRGKDAFMI